MPFLARQDGQTVIPEEVEDGEDVTCPACDRTMRARGPFVDGRARHFYHLSTEAAGHLGCEGSGESDPHRKMKSLAVSALRQAFAGDYDRCAPEVTLDVSTTATDPDQRRADAFLFFTEQNVFYGNGVIIEVQYRNEAKNIRATTHDYLSLGYSVYWATADDFTTDQFQLDRMEAAFDAQDEDVAYAPYYADPPALTTGTPNTTDGAAEESPTSEHNSYTTTDPEPDCRHIFLPREDEDERVHRCVRCGLDAYTADDRAYKPQEFTDVEVDGKFVYDAASLEDPALTREVHEEGIPPTHTHHWQKFTDLFGGTKYKCWMPECESTMIVTADAVRIEHNSSTECDHTWDAAGSVKICLDCGKQVARWDS